MKTFITMLMVLGLVGLAVAQDLDAPTSGVAIDKPDADNGVIGGTAYDIIVARILQNEARYIARQIREAEWMVWGRDYWGWSSQMMTNWGGDLKESAAESNAMWEALTPAEAAAAVEQMSASHERVIAAGLN